MASEQEGAVRTLLSESNNLDSTNDIDYLLGLIGEAIRSDKGFTDDTERAQWVVAQWSQEVGYQPDLTEYPTGKTVPRGTVPPRLSERGLEDAHV
ncbi:MULTISPECIES: hypothetical protein [unclassified Haloarcula]|uniref:hypothetical protein n=1 Tax=unclassified Haloarcula TaxID=2624677 RepID=UPI000678B3AE|nr:MULTISPECIES: hypothetical protein [unclassified Haloarcula]